MRSYFVRHTDKLLVWDENLKELWNQHRVAIHYPDTTSGLGDEDNRSLNPEHYEGTAKTAISRLVELAKDGGYVWAENLVSEKKAAMAGFVKPETEIELYDAFWDLRGRADVTERRDGHPAVLKTVKISRAKFVPRREQVGLRAGRPQQGTMSYWNVGGRLADLVEGRTPERVWSNLSTAQQEAVCAEFLREMHDGRPELPRLRRLLLPAGRTLQDIDLHGRADDGREVFGQVTYHPLGSSPAKKKLAVLEPYGGRGAHLVFFCPGSGRTQVGGAHFVSCDEEVLPWLNGDDGYAGAMFSV